MSKSFFDIIKHEHLYSIAHSIWMNDDSGIHYFGQADEIYQQLIAIEKGWA